MRDMNILEIAAIAITATLLTTVLKGHQPEIAIAISIVCGVLIFAISSVYLKNVFEAMLDIADNADIDFSFIEVLMKIIGIAYISEFTSRICRDAGETAIALKAELAGKILILFMSAPIILSVLELLTGII